MNALRKVNKQPKRVRRQPTRPSGRRRPSQQPSQSSRQVSEQIEPFSDIVDVERPRLDIEDEPDNEEDNFSRRQQNRPKRQIKLLDSEGNVIELPPVNRQKYKFTSSSKETRHYRSVIPWMKNKRNDGIFILPIGSTDISPYIVKKVSGVKYNVKHNNQTFVRASEKFRQLMVDFRFKRNQIDEVLYVETPNNVLKFKVGYLIGNKLLIQNEKMFSEEMNFFNDGLDSQYSRIMKIRDEPISEDIKRLGVIVLSKALHDVAPNVLTYGIYDRIVKRDTSYNLKVIDMLLTKSLTVNEFFEYLGNIVIFITTINFSNVFRERLKEEYYLPEILANLPLSEKLPEIYDRNINNREEEKHRMDEIIEQSLKIFVYRLLVLAYVRRNPTERIESGTVNGTVNYSITPDISTLFNKMSDWKSNCVNVDNIPDNEIVLYKDENENVYCLSIPEVVKSIELGNIMNKHTGKEYSEEFIEYINKYYTIVEKEEEKPEEDDSDLVEDMEDLNINNELDIEDLFADLEMDEQEGENLREIQEEVTTTTRVDISNNSNQKKCPTCKKMFNATGAYKTIDNNSEQVEYCSMECFDK